MVSAVGFEREQSKIIRLDSRKVDGYTIVGTLNAHELSWQNRRRSIAAVSAAYTQYSVELYAFKWLRVNMVSHLNQKSRSIVCRRMREGSRQAVPEVHRVSSWRLRG